MRRTVQCFSALALCGIGFAAGRLTITQPTPEFNPEAPTNLVRSSFVQPPADTDDEENEADENEQDEGMEMMVQAGTPGPHHTPLKTLEGDWTGFVRITMAPGAEPMQMPATIHREWIMNGRYIKETVKSETPDGPFEGMSIIGYDNIDGVYQSMWIDNMSTGITTESGAYNREKQAFHFYGSHRDVVSGRLVMGDATIDVTNPNRHVMTGNEIGPDGAPFQNFYGVFERVK